MSATSPRLANGRNLAALLLLACISTSVVAAAEPAAPAKTKANYERPFEPPTRSALIPLPPGAVQPQGWLRDWCLAAKDGYTSRMDDIDIAFRQAWAADYKVSGDRISLWELGGWPYEGGGYWFDGLAKLGFVLHDDALIQQAKKRLDVVVDNMNPNSIEFMWWLDRNKPDDLKAVEGRGKREPEWPMWVNGLMGRALVGYYAGSGNNRILKALETAYSGSQDWVRLGWAMSNPWPAFETYTWTGNPKIKQSLTTLFEKGGSNSADWSWNRYYLKPPSDKPHAEPTTHGVHFCETTVPWALGYLWTGKREFLDNVLRWHDMIERDCMQPYGVPVFDEYFAPTGAFRGTETCDVAGYMWGQTLLLSISGQGRIADRIERAFFNAAPGCIGRDFRTHAYFQSPNRMADKSLPEAGQYSFKDKHIPLCCSANVNRILPNYVSNMWMATRDNGLAAVCYGPCKVNALVADNVPVEIICKTDYPFNETIEITVNPKREAKFPLLFRIPSWSSAHIEGNGQPLLKSPDKNGFVRIDRTWKRGDKVQIEFSMSPRIAMGRDANSGNAPYATVSLGPLLFSLPIADTKDGNTPDPKARWQYALDTKDAVYANPDLVVERSAMPDRWSWPLQSPVRIRARVASVDWRPTAKEPLPPKVYDGGKPAEWVDLIPYGCTKLRISMFPVTKWTLDTERPTPKDTEGWGPEKDGLRTRLLPNQKEYFIGRAVSLRVEMKNFGDTKRFYDAQQIAVNDPVEITGPDGKRVRYIDDGCQTIGSANPLLPGETVVLCDDLDLNSQYLLVKAGRYTIRTRPHGGRPAFEPESGASDIPASGDLTIEIRPGTTCAGTQLLAQIAEVLPGDWDFDFVHERFRGDCPPGWERVPVTVVPIENGWSPDSKRESIDVTIWIAKKKLAWSGTQEFDVGKGTSAVKISPEEGAVYLGKCPEGHVYWKLPKGAEKEWPAIKKDIVAALKVTPPEPAATAPK